MSSEGELRKLNDSFKESKNSIRSETIKVRKPIEYFLHFILFIIIFGYFLMYLPFFLGILEWVFSLPFLNFLLGPEIVTNLDLFFQIIILTIPFLFFLNQDLRDWIFKLDLKYFFVFLALIWLKNFSSYIASNIFGVASFAILVLFIFELILSIAKNTTREKFDMGINILFAIFFIIVFAFVFINDARYDETQDEITSSGLTFFGQMRETFVQTKCSYQEIINQLDDECLLRKESEKAAIDPLQRLSVRASATNDARKEFLNNIEKDLVSFVYSFDVPKALEIRILNKSCYFENEREKSFYVDDVINEDVLPMDFKVNEFVECKNITNLVMDKFAKSVGDIYELDEDRLEKYLQEGIDANVRVILTYQVNTKFTQFLPALNCENIEVKNKLENNYIACKYVNLDNAQKLGFNFNQFSNVLSGGNVVNARSTNFKSLLPFKLNDLDFVEEEIRYNLVFTENSDLGKLISVQLKDIQTPSFLNFVGDYSDIYKISKSNEIPLPIFLKNVQTNVDTKESILFEYIYLEAEVIIEMQTSSRIKFIPNMNLVQDWISKNPKKIEGENSFEDDFGDRDDDGKIKEPDDFYIATYDGISGNLYYYGDEKRYVFLAYKQDGTLELRKEFTQSTYEKAISDGNLVIY